MLLDALDCLLRSHASNRQRPRSALIARQVARVEEAIIGRVGENLGVDALAALAGCSPFHLCRIFRGSTGQSLRQFRMQQRLGTALGRLGEGEDDLAALACDVGFSSHSHMTDAFRQSLGMSPRETRLSADANEKTCLNETPRALEIFSARKVDGTIWPFPLSLYDPPRPGRFHGQSDENILRNRWNRTNASERR